MTDRDGRFREEMLVGWHGLRALWNEYDPIGIMGMPDSPLDEYDSYIVPHLQLLENDQSVEAIFEHVRAEVVGHMGMPWSPELATKTHAFAAKSCAWYVTKSLPRA